MTIKSLTNGATKPKQNRWRNHGLSKDAKALGVSSVWLYLVLSGKAKNPALLTRLEELKRRQLDEFLKDFGAKYDVIKKEEDEQTNRTRKPV